MVGLGIMTFSHWTPAVAREFLVHRECPDQDLMPTNLLRPHLKGSRMVFLQVLHGGMVGQKKLDRHLQVRTVTIHGHQLNERWQGNHSMTTGSKRVSDHSARRDAFGPSGQPILSSVGAGAVTSELVQGRQHGLGFLREDRGQSSREHPPNSGSLFCPWASGVGRYHLGWIILIVIFG